jgi:hypothetical protein
MKEEHKFRGIENSADKIFGHKREDVTEAAENSRNESLCSLYLVLLRELKDMRRALRDLSADRSVIVKWARKETGREGMD